LTKHFCVTSVTRRLLYTTTNTHPYSCHRLKANLWERIIPGLGYMCTSSDSKVTSGGYITEGNMLYIFQTSGTFGANQNMHVTPRTDCPARCHKSWQCDLQSSWRVAETTTRKTDGNADDEQPSDERH